MCKEEEIKWKCKRSPHNENELKMSQMILNKAPIDMIDYPSYLNLTEENYYRVKDQQKQGVCAGMAASILRESFLKDKSKELSPAFLYWQSRKSEGDTSQDNGVYLETVLQVLKDYGVCEEKYMRFNPDIYDKEPSKKAYSDAKAYKIDKYISIDNGISGIKSYLFNKRKPVIFGMEIYENFIKETKKTGIVPIPKRDEKPIDGHSALIVGYKDNTFKDNLIAIFNHKRSKYGYFIILNSYGKEFGGHNGICYVPYDLLLQNKAYDFYVITTKDNKNYESEVIQK